MERRLSAYIGCLLGLAAGDGLGHGPEPVNGYLPTSAPTSATLPIRVRHAEISKSIPQRR